MRSNFFGGFTMIICPNCLKKHNEGTHYCDDCGFDLLNEHVEAPKVAVVSNEPDAPVNEESADAAIEANADENSADETAHAADEYDFLNIDGEGDDMPYDRVKSKKKNSRKVRRFDKKKTIKAVAITMAALIFVSAVVITLSIIFAEKVYPGYMLYVKDDELLYQSFEGGSAVVLPVYPEDVEDFRLYGSLCRLSDDGMSLIFAQEYSYGDSVIDLSYINFALPNPTPVTIGYNAIAYSVNENADTITYLREHEDGNKLFRYTVYNGGRVQIAENVDKFIASNDGISKIFYESDGCVFVFDGDKSTQLATRSTIAWGADKKMYFFREEEIDGYDCNTLYYFDGKNCIKLIDDCYEVIHTIDATYGALVLANDDGDEAVYYVVNNTATKLNIEDFDYFVNNFWIDEDGKTMYYLDEVDENESDDYSDPLTVFEGLLYKATLTKDGVKDIEEIDEDVNNGFFFGKGQFIYTKETEISSGVPTFEVYLNGEYVDELISAVLHIDGDDVYCMANYDSSLQTYSIYRNGKRIVDDVLDTYVFDGTLMYVKASAEYEDYYDIFDQDSKLIIEAAYSYDFSAEHKIVYYYDWDEDLNWGDLRVYEDGKVTKLGDEICMYVISLSGDVLYVEDVDSTDSGDIYYLKDGERYRIEKDLDVTYLGIIDCIGVISDSTFVSVEEANDLADSYYDDFE